MLWMVFAAIASDYEGYRGMARFCRCNAAFCTTYFGLPAGLRVQARGPLTPAPPRPCHTRYYITRLPTTPVAELAAGIRGH